MMKRTILMCLLFLLAGTVCLWAAEQSELEQPAVDSEPAVLECGVTPDLDLISVSEGSSSCGLINIGPCQLPENRDAAIPQPTDEIKYIRLFFNVFRESDGSNPAATATDIATTVNIVNQAYLPYRIQFVYDMRFISNTNYRYITASTTLLDSDPVFLPMKDAYSVNPASQLNIFVTEINPGTGGFSFGRYPWLAVALGQRGGVVMTRQHMPPQLSGIVAVHEIGHNLGLYHTFAGVSEAPPCGSCGEVPSTPDRDVVGDFCSDTWPTPVNSSCVQPGGLDPCFAQPWGVTDTQNYMGYSTACWSEFSPQQAGRMHCCIDTYLTSWLTTTEVCGADTTYIAAADFDTLGINYSWISARDLGTRLPLDQFYNNFAPNPLDDGTTGPHPVSFGAVEFYDKVFSNLYIGVNGAISFQDIDVNANGFFAPTSIPGAPFATLIAPFYNDLIIDTLLEPDAGIYLYQTTDTMVIEWHKVANFNNPSSTVTFQCILSVDDNVLFQYQNVEGSGLTPTSLIGMQDNTCARINYFSVSGDPTNEVFDSSNVWLRRSTNEPPCCVADRGDVNGDGVDADPIDLSFLVDFLFASGSLPPCDEEADLNADMAIADPIDLSYLVDFLFASGSSPAACR